MRCIWGVAGLLGKLFAVYLHVFVGMGVWGVAGLRGTSVPQRRASRGILHGRYGRCMGEECVVFAGWPAYGGRAFAVGRRMVFAGMGWYERCMGGLGICGVAAGLWGTSVRGGVYLRVYGRGMRGICGVAGLRVGRAFAEASRVVSAGYIRSENGRGMRGICGGGVWAGNAWYLRGGRSTGGRVFAETSRRVRVVFAGGASRRVRVVFAGYGRCMGGECVVFAGWPACEGRAFAWASRGICRE